MTSAAERLSTKSLFVVLACSAILFAALFSGCAADTGTQSASISTAAYQTTPPTISTAALQSRGQVVATTGALPEWTAQLPPGTRVTRITYRSTSGIDGSPTLVTGSVFVPAGAWPPGGWPLIVYAHGTTGITRDCAPSDRPDMFGDLRAVAGNLAAGYAVVTTDYLGLGLRSGETRLHPYLEPRSAAYNVIDAARAARSIEPTIGPRWIAAGASQGGAAAWATAEEFGSYGGGNGSLSSGDLVGVVAISPVLDLAFLADRAHDGTLNQAQRYLYPLVVVGLSHTNPRINPDDHLHGVAADRRATLISCSTGKTALAAQLRSPDPSIFVATSPTAQRELATTLRAFSLPRTATDIPILAIYGSADEITPVDVMEVGLGRGCAVGDHLTRVRREGQGHSLDPGPVLGQWVLDRMKGLATESDC